MQRLFFAFPTGLPGAGLLLLRFAVALTGLYEGHLFLTTSAATFSVLVALRLAFYTAAFFIFIGMATPIASFSIFAGAACCLLGSWTSWSSFSANDMILLNLATMTVVNAAVGPGAFSVDARLFGRREIVLPD